MAKKTKLQGFYQGASQIVEYMKDEVITQSQYDNEYERIQKSAAKIADINNSSEAAKLREQLGKLQVRKTVSDSYAAFKNYTKQMQELYSGEKIGLTYDEIRQLAANNRAVEKLNFKSGDLFKYGVEGSRALNKFIGIIMDNDYKKLQYLHQFPEATFKKIKFNDLSNVSLPKSDDATYEDCEALKRRMNELSERLKKLDNNIHINSAEFKNLKAAVNALTETLKNPNSDNFLIGEQLETLQAASMDYVKAKGVGRQSSQLGKGRMDLALDICSVSATYMDLFASRERINEVEEFERKVMGVKITYDAVCEEFTDFSPVKVKPNIFEENENDMNALDQKIEDDYKEEMEDEDEFEF